MAAGRRAAPEPSLEKTQLNIPLSAVREAEEDQPGKFGKNPKHSAPGPADHFDFEGLRVRCGIRRTISGRTVLRRRELGDEEDIEDFRTPADIAPIRHDLQSSLFSLNVRIAVVAVLFAGTLYFALAQTAGLRCLPLWIWKLSRASI